VRFALTASGPSTRDHSGQLSLSSAQAVAAWTVRSVVAFAASAMQFLNAVGAGIEGSVLGVKVEPFSNTCHQQYYRFF
jgi:hypothetical protein